MKRLISRLKELYTYFQYEPIGTWREYLVIVLTDLPLLLILPLTGGHMWAWLVAVTLWQFVSIMLFCLYRERKMKQHANRHE